MPLRRLSLLALLYPAAPVSAQCPLEPLPVDIESLDSNGDPDATFAGVGHDVAIAPGRIAVSSVSERLFPAQSAEPFQGAVWVLEPAAQGGWATADKLRGAFEPVSTFGFSVAFAGPDEILVGNPGNCPLDCVQTGPRGDVVAFQRGPQGWVETQTLASPVPFDNDSFGVTLAADGDLLAVGASAGTTFTPRQVGSVHVFERTPAGWVHRARLLPPGPQWAFGRELSLAGGLLAVADPGVPVAGGFPGAVHLFRVGADAGTWSHVATLGPAAHDTTFSRFAASVATDGTRVAVGVPGADLSIDPFAVLGTEPGARQSGGVDVFLDTGAGFAREARVAPADPEIGAGFGTSVALDGGRLAVGAPSATSGSVGGRFTNRTGLAHVFELRGERWAPLDVLEITSLDGVHPTTHLDAIGTTLALLGERVVVAAASASFPGAAHRGAAALFELDGGPCDARDLLGAPGLLAVALGGEHVWNVRGGPALAGGAYFVLGSASGTSPGVSVNGFVLPLNFDPYLRVTLALANHPPFSTTLGTLDASGHGTASVALPPSSSPALVGLELHHSAVLFRPPFLHLAGATDPARLALVP